MRLDSHRATCPHCGSRFKIDDDHLFDIDLLPDEGLTEALERVWQITLAHWPRTRGFKERDIRAARHAVWSMIANLEVAAGLNPPVLALPMGKASAPYGVKPGLRYVPLIARKMEAAGLLEIALSTRRGRASSVRPTRKLRAMLARA